MTTDPVRDVLASFDPLRLADQIVPERDGPGVPTLGLGTVATVSPLTVTLNGGTASAIAVGPVPSIGESVRLLVAAGTVVVLGGVWPESAGGALAMEVRASGTISGVANQWNRVPYNTLVRDDSNGTLTHITTSGLHAVRVNVAGWYMVSCVFGVQRTAVGDRRIAAIGAASFNGAPADADEEIGRHENNPHDDSQTRHVFNVGGARYVPAGHFVTARSFNDDALQVGQIDCYSVMQVARLRA